MNQALAPVCKCTTEGYADDCPQVFLQGNRLVHDLTGEFRLKPKIYDSGPTSAGQDGPPAYIPAPLAIDQKDRPSEAPQTNVFAYQMSEEPRSSEMSPRPRVSERDPQMSRYSRNYVTEDQLRATPEETQGRQQMVNFNGSDIIRATIGGLNVDVDRLLREVREIAPLPPVALPIVFKDMRLNFYHHLFNGLETFAGRKLIVALAEHGSYSASDSIVVSPIVKALIHSGYEPGDEEMVTFLKRVVTSTFEEWESSPAKREETAYLVKANLYGFEYIEGGMVCREQDLKMWLHTAYAQYKTTWFNAFKATGVPLFAVKGVQDRYDSRGNLKSAAGADRQDSVNYRNEYRAAKRHSDRSKKGPSMSDTREADTKLVHRSKIWPL